MMNFHRMLVLFIAAALSLSGCERPSHPPATSPVAKPAPVSTREAAPPPSAGVEHATAPVTTSETAVPQVVTGRDGAPMVYVPGGVFMMGTNDGLPEEGPQMNVFLEGFYIDRFEISNERFARFVEETGYGDFGNFSYEEKKGQHPATGLNWRDAKAYCEWAGKRLPSEYEWEKAARGADGRMWPWGNEKKAVARRPSDKTIDTLHEYNDPAGQSPYGCLHMADNVWEWVDDWFEPYVLSDVKDPRFGEIYKVLRGGLFTGPKGVRYSKTTDRKTLEPSVRKKTVGARCAADIRL